MTWPFPLLPIRRRKLFYKANFTQSTLANECLPGSNTFLIESSAFTSLKPGKRGEHVQRITVLNKTIFMLMLTTLLALANVVAADQNRWYSAKQVDLGKVVYAANCASCHGENAESTPNWRETDDQGQYPPPPLNGTAHTWHHSMDILRRTVNEGGAKLGGLMPAFGHVLQDGEVDAVIAYVQSLWPDKIYATWAQANPDDAAGNSSKTSSDDKENPITERLVNLLPPQTLIGDPEETPLNGLYEVNAGGQFVYLDSTGRYGLIGNLIDLDTGENLTEAKRAVERVSKLSSFPKEDKVIFTAEGEQRAYIDVFTDTTCPYCRKLHTEIPQLQAAGISVRYLPFPRGGPGSQGDSELRAVWCAADPVQGMHLAKTQSVIPQNDGACAAAGAVAAGYQLGNELGIRGTPAIVLPDGSIIPGYRPHAELIAALGLGDK